jgi:hypothetical protein
MLDRYSQSDIDTMCSALDIVLGRLAERGFRNFSREHFARLVIECASPGDRDPVRLADAVLSDLIEPELVSRN